MGRFCGNQRRVGFWRFVEKFKHALGLFAIQTDDAFVFNDFFCLPVRSLNNKLVESGTLEIGGGFNGVPHLDRHARYKAGFFFGYCGHGAKMAPEKKKSILKGSSAGIKITHPRLLPVKSHQGEFWFGIGIFCLVISSELNWKIRYETESAFWK